MEKSYVDELVALKSQVLSLSNTSPELLQDQNRFLSDRSFNFLAVLNYMRFDSGKTRS